VAIVSTISSIFPPQIYLWRNYDYSTGSRRSRYSVIFFFLYEKNFLKKIQGTTSGKVWESLRASSCAPVYFDEFSTGKKKKKN
jgi:hypothetical protein